MRYTRLFVRGCGTSNWRTAATSAMAALKRRRRGCKPLSQFPWPWQAPPAPLRVPAARGDRPPLGIPGVRSPARIGLAAERAAPAPGPCCRGGAWCPRCPGSSPDVLPGSRPRRTRVRKRSSLVIATDRTPEMGSPVPTDSSQPVSSLRHHRGAQHHRGDQSQADHRGPPALARSCAARCVGRRPTWTEDPISDGWAAHAHQIRSGLMFNDEADELPQFNARPREIPELSIVGLWRSRVTTRRAALPAVE